MSQISMFRLWVCIRFAVSLIEKMASLEALLVPGLLLTSITLDVVTMCSRGWILGYNGDVVVLQLSPWSFCRLNCLHCAQEKPSFGCYAMHDWSDSHFGKFNHLQYPMYQHIIYRHRLDRFYLLRLTYLFRKLNCYVKKSCILWTLKWSFYLLSANRSEFTMPLPVYSD